MHGHTAPLSLIVEHRQAGLALTLPAVRTGDEGHQLPESQ
jgi:hypothetical protein